MIYQTISLDNTFFHVALIFMTAPSIVIHQSLKL